MEVKIVIKFQFAPEGMAVDCKPTALLRKVVSEYLPGNHWWILCTKDGIAIDASSVCVAAVVNECPLICHLDSRSKECKHIFVYIACNVYRV